MEKHGSALWRELFLDDRHFGYVAYGLDRHTHAHVPHFPHR